MHAIRAVLFDVYGTLVEIARPRGPYRQLIELAERKSGSFDRELTRRHIMAHALSLREVATTLQLTLSDREWTILEDDLRDELASIRLYPETEEVLTELQRRGLQTGLCSNLALPYVPPVLAMIGPLIDVRIWSCAVGALKPERAIYAAALARLELPATSVVMVGDSYVSDVVGARNVGMQALHLDRTSGRGDIKSLLDILDRVP